MIFEKVPRRRSMLNLTNQMVHPTVLMVRTVLTNHLVIRLATWLANPRTPECLEPPK